MSQIPADFRRLYLQPGTFPVRCRAMDNKTIAHELLKGKRKYYNVRDAGQATAIRVAAHRLGGVVTAKAQGKGFKMVKSSRRVTRRSTKAKRGSKRR